MARRLNNTYIYDGSSPCDYGTVSTTPNQCSGKHGGFFDEGSSTTWKQAPNINVSGAATDEDPALKNDIWGTDSLKLNSTLVLEHFPVGIMRTSPEEFNMVGLGLNSTFLSALFSLGAIASKTWALATGWQGADSTTQTDGSLVLGGYDSAKTNGSNITYPFAVDSPCQGELVVTISDIVLNFKDGSSQSLLPPSAGYAVRACLSPDAPVMTLSQDIFNNFLVSSEYSGNDPDRSHGINFWGMVVKSEDAYVLHLYFCLTEPQQLTFSVQLRWRHDHHTFAWPRHPHTQSPTCGP